MTKAEEMKMAFAKERQMSQKMVAAAGVDQS